MVNTPITDEDLTAFLDGELSRADADSIAAALDQNAELQKRLSALEVDFAPVKAAFDQMLDEMPAELGDPLVAAISSEKPNPIWRPALIAAGLALALGIGIGQFFTPAPIVPTPKKPGWLAVVASYQSLYSADTLEGVNPSAAEITQEVERVANLLGASVSPDQLELAELSFKRGQVLSFNGKPLAQFMFQTPSGTPIALCLIATSAEDKAISSKSIGGLNAAVWRKDGFAYLVIGEETTETIEHLAARFEAKI